MAPEIHNRNLEERFRFTLSVKNDGKLGVSCIGMHTVPELIGYLQLVTSMLVSKCLAPNASLVDTDFTDMRRFEK